MMPTTRRQWKRKCRSVLVHVRPLTLHGFCFCCPFAYSFSYGSSSPWMINDDQYSEHQTFLWGSWDWESKGKRMLKCTVVSWLWNVKRCVWNVGRALRRLLVRPLRDTKIMVHIFIGVFRLESGSQYPRMEESDGLRRRRRVPVTLCTYTIIQFEVWTGNGNQHNFLTNTSWDMRKELKKDLRGAVGASSFCYLRGSLCIRHVHVEIMT